MLNLSKSVMQIDKLPKVNKLPRGKKALAGILIVIIVVALAVGSGYMPFVQKNSKNDQEARCGDNTVQRYNEAAKNTESYGRMIEAVAKEVEAKPEYEKDATCVFIVFKHYTYAQNADKSRQLLDLFKALQASGQSVDAKIVNPQTVEQMDMYVKGLEHNRDIGDSADGSG